MMSFQFILRNDIHDRGQAELGFDLDQISDSQKQKAHQNELVGFRLLSTT
jgi:hypothetical protein